MKGSSESVEAVQIKKKGASKGRPLKRVKIAGNAIDIKEKSLLKPVKGPYSSCIIYFNFNAMYIDLITNKSWHGCCLP